MITSDVGSVPEQGQTNFGITTEKKISDFISEDTKIDADGKVTGTLHYVENFAEFGGKQTKGYYFPVKLDDKYSTKEITCKGKSTKKAKDLNWLLFVENTQSKFTFSTVEDGTILTLSFENAVFEEHGQV